MKINKIFLLFLFTLLFIGISYASDVSNDTVSSVDTIDSVDEVIQSSNTAIEVDNTLTDKINKEEIKRDNTLKIDTSKTYTVNDFDTLHNTLTSDEYSTITLNINSDITLTDSTKLNKAIKTLIINGNGRTINGNNTYQFLNISSYTTVTIKDITITNCYSENNGGAIYNHHGNLTVTNSTFTNNKATGMNITYIGGGAIYNHYANLTVADSIFSNNNAIIGESDSYGESILNYKGIITVSSSTFSNNAACKGGAIFNFGNLTVIDSIFTNNNATSKNSYVGGAILHFYGNLTVSNSTFNGNKAGSDGGAISNTKGILTVADSIFSNNNAPSGGAICNYGNVTVFNSIFSNNTGYDGGAIDSYSNLIVIDSIFNNNNATWAGAIHAGPSTVTNSTFNGNKADLDGGAIICSNLTVNNSTFNYNSAGRYSGAIDCSGILTVNNSIFNNNSAGEDGGVVYIMDGKLTFNNCVFNNNALYEGGAIYVFNCNLTVSNSTFSNNKACNGSAIYSKGKIYFKDKKTKMLIIRDNIFIANKANRTGKVIIYDGMAEIVNNTNSETSKYGRTICTYRTDVQIKNNIFYDEFMFINSMNVLNGKYVFRTKVSDGMFNKLNAGRVSYTLDGKWIGSINVVNSTSWISFDVPSIGNHTIVATYINHNGVSSASDIYTFEKKDNVNVLFNQYNVKNGKVIIITTVKDDNGNNITAGRISYSLNNNWIGSIDVKKGSSWISFNYIDSIVTFKATYITDSNITENIHTRKLNLIMLNNLVNQDTPPLKNSSVHIMINSMNMVNGKYVFTTKVTDDKYVRLSVGRVSYTLDGKWIGSINVKNGTSWISFDVPTVGNHTVVATYIDANGKSITTDTYTFEKQSSTDGVNSLFNQYDVKNGKVVIVTAVKNDTGNPIHNGRISYTVNGKWVGSVYVRKGSSWISFNYTGSVVTFKATFITNSGVTQNIYTRTLDLDEIAKLKQA